MYPLYLAAAAAQLAGVALSVSTTLRQYLLKVKQAPKQSRELKGELLLVSDVLEDLKSVIDAAPPDIQTTNTSLLRSLNGFAEFIRELASHIEVQEKDITNRLKWPFTEEENGKYLEKLERFKKTFSLACDALQLYLSFKSTVLNSLVASYRTLKASLIISSKWS